MAQLIINPSYGNSEDPKDLHKWTEQETTFSEDLRVAVIGMQQIFGPDQIDRRYISSGSVFKLCAAAVTAGIVTQRVTSALVKRN